MDAATAFFADFAVFGTAAAWVSLATLTALELVLGIDNIVFLTILTSRLPVEQQARVRRIGLIVALVMRIGLLFAISWVMGLKNALFSISAAGVTFAPTGRDLIMLGGGLFLVAKATHEIYAKLEVEPAAAPKTKGASSLGLVMLQIVLIDMVFSLDSIITAVGMVEHMSIMVVAMILAVAGMMMFAEPVSNFVHKHPSMKILALSFLLLIGSLLVAEGFGAHISKGAIYFAMAFSFVVELVNMRVRKAQHREAPVELHDKFKDQPTPHV